MALVADHPLRILPVPLYRGRRAAISSGYHEANRPNHSGSDFSFRRFPDDGGPPGNEQMPNYALHYFNPAGLPIVAAGDGVIRFAGVIGTGGDVKLTHAGGWQSEYRHLEKIFVKEGQRVS